MLINSFLNTVKDKRENRGKRYNLSSVLNLMIGGLLQGCNIYSIYT